MRADAEGELGDLKHSAVVLTDASVLWAKAGNLLTITAADQLSSIESVRQLLEKASDAPDFDDSTRHYAGDLQATLIRFANPWTMAAISSSNPTPFAVVRRFRQKLDEYRSPATKSGRLPVITRSSIR